jgi:uncharacterized damage-inducible protein DinB
MHAGDVTRLIDYVSWVRDRTLLAAAAIPADSFASPTPAASRDLRGTLVHELESEWAWRIRLTAGAFPTDGLAPSEYPSVDALAERWRVEEQLLRGWAATLDDAALAARPPGAENVQPLSDYVIQIVAHAIQQFTEAGVLLTSLGHSPGNIDYIAYREAGR